MNKSLLALACGITLIGCTDESAQPKPANLEFDTQIKVMTTNLWHDLKYGYDAGVAEMRYSNADIIFTQESDGANARLAEDLKMHYWQGREGRASVGILSKYPIVEVIQGRDEGLDIDRGHQIGAVLDINGRDVVVWNSHLDWKKYTAIEPRGLDGDTSSPHDLCLPDKVTPQALDAYNETSHRPAQARYKAAKLKKYIDAGTPVITAGDFNEPSGTDWKENNVLFDRTASDYDFSTHRIVREAGLTDSFRELYPDTLQYPGITWPFRNSDSWTKASKTGAVCGRAIDDRDRIDFIYYNQKANGMKLEKVAFVGPRYATYYEPVDGFDKANYQTTEPHEGRMVDEHGEPQYSISTDDFQSDHLWYSATFTVKTPAQSASKKSLDMNPRFEDISLATTDGMELVVNFRLANWNSFDSNRSYEVRVTSHSDYSEGSAGGIAKVTEKPAEIQQLAFKVANSYLQQLKKKNQKLQLRLFTRVGGSPKVMAAKTLTMAEIEKVVNVDLPPEPKENAQ